VSRRSLSVLRSAIGQRVRLREPLNHQPPAAAAPEVANRDVELLDWVRLSRPFEGWPGGTIGAVVDLDGSDALVEIADEQGHTVDLFNVPVELLRVDA
jgi:hypothetical protein